MTFCRRILDEHRDVYQRHVMKERKTDYSTHIDDDTITGLNKHLTSSVRTQGINNLAHCRGMRVRIIRNIGNFNISEFSNIVGIEEGSLGRIERGSTCLSILKAKNICDNLYKRTNILVSAKWLLSGKGKAILKIKTDSIDISKVLYNVLIDVNTMPDNLTHYMMLCAAYMRIYKDQNPITIFVNDASMSNVYKKGDIVGGLEVEKNLYKSIFAGQPCIVIKKNGQTLVRNVFNDKSTDEMLILASTNNDQPICVSYNDIVNIYLINCSLKTPLPKDDLISEDEDVTGKLQDLDTFFRDFTILDGDDSSLDTVELNAEDDE